MTNAGLLDTSVRYVSPHGDLVETVFGEVDAAELQRALPVRRTHSHRGQKHRPGLFWSATTGGHVPYESWLELDRLWLADADPDVIWIAAQPMALAGTDGSTRRAHVPDLLITRRTGPPLVVDIKPEKFAREPKVAAVFAWTARVCRSRGWDFEVWTGADPTLLANTRALGFARRYNRGDLPALEATHPARVRQLTIAWHHGDLDSNETLTWESLNAGAL